MASHPALQLVRGRVDRIRLIVGMVLFFVGTLELLRWASPGRRRGSRSPSTSGSGSTTSRSPRSSGPSLTTSTRRGGREVVPAVIAIGATAGTPLGAKLTQMLFAGGVGLFAMLQIAGAILLVTLALFVFVTGASPGVPARRRWRRRPSGPARGCARLRQPYLRRIALLLSIAERREHERELHVDSAFDRRRRAGAGVGARSRAARKARWGALREFYSYQNIVAACSRPCSCPASSRCSACGACSCCLPRWPRGLRPHRDGREQSAVVRNVKIAGERDRLLGHEHPDAGCSGCPLGARRNTRRSRPWTTFFVRVGDALSAGQWWWSGVARVAPGELRVAEPRPWCSSGSGGARRSSRGTRQLSARSRRQHAA